ncbi:peptidoglycan DD-metalloendopeptidase family protein [Thalassobaculum sp. OXR-137]|uniref:M23 family metallopeptidase n=1 Tax=Thalassobaculum sp. OXR-137 TaxID=3100173 RepID=UPI002AC89CEE|nr:peptidoglycan DD-metalloendopeptidase family protein [Thalassobaculum sp. OXR-137]WPZ35813.1 peptidoglycan DD-metalloendopeptidase family protein [Thalassobaculum sp. OXR-137]
MVSALAIALIIDRDTPARAAATDTQTIDQATGHLTSAPAPAPRPKYDTELVRDAHRFAVTPEPEDRVVTVAPGDTLIKLLMDNGVDRATAHTAIDRLSDVYDVRRLQIGQDIVLTFQEQAAGPAFLGLSLQPSAERDIEVRADTDSGFVAEEVVRELEHRDDFAAAKIQSSLYEAALDAGMPIDVLVSLVRVFSFDVDFQRDVQAGDSFEVMFDTYEDELGNRVRNGEIQYASMTLSGKKVTFYRYTPASGITDYFDPKGQSVRKTLMRTPIDGARLSSGFGKRKHPILGYTKMHKGVDFAARSGTPIMAAGDGVVEIAGRNGGYGNYVRLRHNSTIKTAYAHMSKFAKGMGKGKRVKQGDIIGYVGTTGRSTGPHLHYEVLVDNRQENPMSVKLPAGEQLKGKELDKFRRFLPAIDQRVASLRSNTAVASR